MSTQMFLIFVLLNEPLNGHFCPDAVFNLRKQLIFSQPLCIKGMLVPSETMTY